MKSAEISCSVSDLVNDAVRELLREDAEDLAAFEDRVSEPLISYGDMLKRLEKNGQL